MGEIDVHRSEMKVEFYSENINKESADIRSEKKDNRTTDVINVEKILCVENFLTVELKK